MADTFDRNPLSITCPNCRKAFRVPVEVLGIDGHMVRVRIDRSKVYGHVQDCKGPDPEPAKAEPGKVVDTPRDTLPKVAPLTAATYVAKGRRACLMCGVPGPECMDGLGRERKACCPACGDGNTHPAPQDTVPCASWAADR